MIRIMKRVLYIAFAGLSLLASCKKDKQAGKLQLQLSKNVAFEKHELTSKAGEEVNNEVDINNFVIEISKSENWQRKFDRFGDMPQVLTLPEDKYTITAYSPDAKDATFSGPSYRGSADFTIVAGNVTPVTLQCSISNVKVSFNLSEDFKKELSNYEIQVTNAASWDADDVAEKTLIWHKEDLDQKKPGYFTAAPLYFRISGYRAIDSKPIETKEGVIGTVAPKDHWSLNLGIAIMGKAGGFEITLDKTLNEKNTDIKIDGWAEVPVEGRPKNNEEEKPSTAPSMIWEANPEFNEMEIANPMSVDLVVKAPEKIKNFTVSVDSKVLSGAVAAMGGDNSYTYEEGKPYVMDLIGNAALIENLRDMLPTGDKLYQQTQVNFSLSNLLPLVLSLDPEKGSKHIFTLKVEDMKEQTYTKSLVFVAPK